MSDTEIKGNNPERWQKLLSALDERLQLGLLDRLKKIVSYHFETDTLTLEPLNLDEQSYLSKDPIFQQLQVLAQDAVGIEKIKFKQPAE